MYILGINAYHGDSAACLLKDGVIISATEEERFRRIKHWAGFPSLAIKFCLEDAGITITDIDYITISRDPKANFLKKVIYSLKYSIGLSTIWDRFMNFKKVSSVKGELAAIFNLKETDIRAELYNIEHHRSHIASSFFASRFEKSAILSIEQTFIISLKIIFVPKLKYSSYLNEALSKKLIWDLSLFILILKKVSILLF